MKATRTQFILSIVFMAVGFLFFGVSTAIACAYCEVADLINFTNEQNLRINAAVGELAAPGKQAGVRSLIEDSVVAHVQAGYTKNQALTHVEEIIESLK